VVLDLHICTLAHYVLDNILPPRLR
jgi:hypothetical protein